MFRRDTRYEEVRSHNMNHATVAKCRSAPAVLVVLLLLVVVVLSPVVSAKAKPEGITPAVLQSSFCQHLFQHVVAAVESGDGEQDLIEFFARFKAEESVLVPLNLFCGDRWVRQAMELKEQQITSTPALTTVKQLLMPSGDVKKEVDMHLTRDIPDSAIINGICTAMLRPTREDRDSARAALKKFLEASTRSQRFSGALIELCREVWVTKGKEIMEESRDHDAKLKKMAESEKDTPRFTDEL